jgi:hypothetical protein
MQGLQKPVDVIFGIITAFEKKLKVYKCEWNT